MMNDSEFYKGSTWSEVQKMGFENFKKDEVEEKARKSLYPKSDYPYLYPSLTLNKIKFTKYDQSVPPLKSTLGAF